MPILTDLVLSQVWVLVQAELPGVVTILDIHVPDMTQQAPHVLLTQPSRPTEVHEQQIEAHPNNQTKDHSQLLKFPKN